MLFEKENKKYRYKLLLIMLSLFLLKNIKKKNAIESLKIYIASDLMGNNKKYWVGEKYKIIISKYPKNAKEKIYFKTLNDKTIFVKGYLFLNFSGRQCITAFTKKNKINSTFCFYISKTPELYFKETNPLRIEINFMKKLILESRDYPKKNIKYNSSNSGIIKISNQGIITAIRPGKTIINAFGLDFKGTKLEVFAVSNNGLINNYTLKENKAELYKNLMIVAHPDDEILWGGANLYKYSYFVVCLTNGNIVERANIIINDTT